MKYQVIIIGGGPAGYTAAEAAGKAGLSVLLFEKQNLGGVCLNEGCIPTKTLLYSAKTYDGVKHASKYAVNVPEASFDLAKIIIITDGLRLQIGFNEDEIHQFIPREVRRVASRRMTEALIQMDLENKRYA